MPIVILLIVAVWIAGCLPRVYGVARRVGAAFSSTPASPTGQLLVLTVGLILFALVNFISFPGWVVNLMVIFPGLGALLQRGTTLLGGRPRVAGTARCGYDQVIIDRMPARRR